MSITLRDITLSNYFSVIGLSVTKEQEAFVASNAISLAEAYVYQKAGHFVAPLAIYDQDLLIGFTFIVYDETLVISPGNYLLFRLMIDQNYQGKGYFIPVMDSIVNYIKSHPAGEGAAVWLSYEAENHHVRSCYRHYGFVETGETYAGEIVAMYQLTQ
ncbi:GNAT family N-acetyltransferase [Streptococcus ovuberis]|uniref:GNAT family N-acetyltransferase n=1 Tax=Streptococcus ovuberis TaxID=1936207 RepID=A0A7X6N0J5_9STRE|nr:GNAT family N-acetyltransferase [Streptococcus ovuberis]NKZ21149.1 GNAT family N-acetyltransferase [Streptococcus ovuberis]